MKTTNIFCFFKGGPDTQSANFVNSYLQLEETEELVAEPLHADLERAVNSPRVADAKKSAPAPQREYFFLK